MANALNSMVIGLSAGQRFKSNKRHFDSQDANSERLNKLNLLRNRAVNQDGTMNQEGFRGLAVEDSAEAEQLRSTISGFNDAQKAKAREKLTRSAIELKAIAGTGNPQKNWSSYRAMQAPEAQAQMPEQWDPEFASSSINKAKTFAQLIDESKVQQGQVNTMAKQDDAQESTHTENALNRAGRKEIAGMNALARQEEGKANRASKAGASKNGGVKTSDINAAFKFISEFFPKGDLMKGTEDATDPKRMQGILDRASNYMSQGDSPAEASTKALRDGGFDVSDYSNQAPVTTQNPAQQNKSGVTARYKFDGREFVQQ